MLNGTSRVGRTCWTCLSAQRPRRAVAGISRGRPRGRNSPYTTFHLHFCDALAFTASCAQNPTFPRYTAHNQCCSATSRARGARRRRSGRTWCKAAGRVLATTPRIAHSQRCRKYSGWVFCEMAGAVQPFARNPAEIKFNRFALTRKSSLPTLLAERTCTAPVASTANSTSSMNSCRVRRGGGAKGTWAAHARFVSGHAVRI